MFVAYKKKTFVIIYLHYTSHLKYLQGFTTLKKPRESSFLFLRAPKHFKVGKQILKRYRGLGRSSFSINTFGLFMSSPTQVTYTSLLTQLRIYTGYSIYPKHCKLFYSCRIKFN